MHLGGDQDSEHPSPNPDATTATSSSAPQVEKAREALEQMSVENGGAGKS